MSDIIGQCFIHLNFNDETGARARPNHLQNETKKNNIRSIRLILQLHMEQIHPIQTRNDSSGKSSICTTGYTTFAIVPLFSVAVCYYFTIFPVYCTHSFILLRPSSAFLLSSLCVWLPNANSYHFYSPVSRSFSYWSKSSLHIIFLHFFMSKHCMHTNEISDAHVCRKCSFYFWCVLFHYSRTYSIWRECEHLARFVFIFIFALESHCHRLNRISLCAWLHSGKLLILWNRYRNSIPFSANMVSSNISNMEHHQVLCKVSV